MIAENSIDYNLQNQVLNICKGVSKYYYMLYNPAPIYKVVYTQLQSLIIATTGSLILSQAYHTETQQDKQGKEVYK
jgi:hypothetical protein